MTIHDAKLIKNRKLTKKKLFNIKNQEIKQSLISFYTKVQNDSRYLFILSKSKLFKCNNKNNTYNSLSKCDVNYDIKNIL